jgi:hypothetical protein
MKNLTFLKYFFPTWGVLSVGVFISTIIGLIDLIQKRDIFEPNPIDNLIFYAMILFFFFMVLGSIIVMVGCFQYTRRIWKRD